MGKPSKGTKSESRAAKDLWFRDAAIVGTAIAEGFDMAVSTENRLFEDENFVNLLRAGSLDAVPDYLVSAMRSRRS